MSYLHLIKDLPLKRIKRSGEDYVMTLCPFHKEGREHSPSFSINTITGSWRCFTCHDFGSFDELVHRLTGRKTSLSTEDILKIIENALMPEDESKNNIEITEEDVKKYRENKNEYLLQRVEGSQQTIDHFELGYDPERKSIIIPIRDEYNKLCGFTERKSEVTNGNRYISHIRKSDYLFNLTTAKQYKKAIVVEGAFDVINLYRHGFPNAVALLGSAISSTQLTLLLRYFTDIIVALDNDLAGKEGKIKIIDKLLGKVGIATLTVPEHLKDVGEMSKDELEHAFKNLKWQ